MIISTAAVLADANGWDGHMGWGGAWMAIFGTLMMAGLVVLIVWLVRATPTSTGSQHLSEDPLASAQRILAERFARGELSADEYRERTDQLR